MDNMITLTIDGIEVQAPQGSTVLEAARLAGIRIPTLCFLKDINEIGACRMCVVDPARAPFRPRACFPDAGHEGQDQHAPDPRLPQKPARAHPLHP